MSPDPNVYEVNEDLGKGDFIKDNHWLALSNIDIDNFKVEEELYKNHPSLRKFEQVDKHMRLNAREELEICYFIPDKRLERFKPKKTNWNIKKNTLLGFINVAIGF